MVRFLLIKNTAKPYVALQYLTWLRAFPLVKGRGEHCSSRGLPSSARRWDLFALLWCPKFFVRFCSQNFDHCHLFASLYHPLGALRLIAPLPSSRRSWKNKPHLHNIKNNDRFLPTVIFSGCGSGICFSRASRKIVVSTVYPKGKFAKANFLLILLRFTTKDFVQIPH